MRTINTNWYIVTGAPCSGKTEVIKNLSSLEYNITPEIPRLIIDAEMKKGKTVREIRKDEAEFQKRILQMKIKIENELPPEQITFIDDGGIPACIAYFKIAGLDPEPALREVKKRKYRGIFFLERLPYKKDYARIEDIKTAEKLGKLLRKTYQNLGYRVIKVPVKPIGERVKFILNKMDVLG